MDHAPQVAAEGVRQAWKRANLSPLWESATAHKPDAGPAQPMTWRWTDVRPLIEHALAMNSPAAVERRVLLLSNPADPERDVTIGPLCVALQSLLPGETARPHRHSMNAIRLLLEGNGAETLVDGKPCRMEYGDLILTPGWCWHEHRHNGSDPVVWLDALDVPLHEFLGTTAFQPGPINSELLTLDDAAFDAAGMIPQTVAGTAPHSPMFRYPFADAKRSVQRAPVLQDGTRRVRYSNPQNGDSAIPLMDCSLISITPQSGKVPTTTTNCHTVCCVLEGSGTTSIGDTTVTWRERDIFTIPPGNAVKHDSQDGILFTVSDRDLLSRLGLLKEGSSEQSAVY
ncbi:cupin domain-containing protein [Roseiarcaceae bacterium H3SJ34-1]|uniref:cupin domain-containing protein n=1 Tax=Terripilifer ovatus TaxID=3032367 RepID=UPI003AB96156|nr:cupin domain-containing protein [Roseiarcaceae bacterium H3SJ34-1]